MFIDITSLSVCDCQLENIGFLYHLDVVFEIIKNRQIFFKHEMVKLKNCLNVR